MTLITCTLAVSVSPLYHGYGNVTVAADQLQSYSPEGVSLSFVDPPTSQASDTYNWNGLTYSEQGVLVLYDQVELLLYFQSSTFSVGGYSVTNIQGQVTQCSYSAAPTAYCSAIALQTCGYFQAMQVYYCPSPSPTTLSPTTFPPGPYHPYRFPYPWWYWLVTTGVPSFVLAAIISFIVTLVLKQYSQRRADYVSVN